MRERAVHINLRVTETEKDIIVRNARKCGLSVSEFLRKLALGYIPKAMPPFEYQQLNHMLMTLYAAFKENSTPENAEVIVRFVRGLEDEFLNVERRILGAPAKQMLCGETEHSRSGEPFVINDESDERSVM